MKKLGMIVITIIVAVVVLSFFKDVIIKTSVEKGVEMVTGLQLRVSSFRVGIINTLVGIRNLRLYNPKGYQDKIMLDMPEIYVDYDLPAIVQGNVHLNEMRINMSEFMVVKNEKGELNLDALKVVQAEKEGKKPQEKDKGKAEMPEIRIDELELKIGKVVYKDYSGGGKPSVKEFKVNLNERYENITDPYKLVSLIVVKALMNTTIANLTNFDLGGLQGTVSDTLATAQKAAMEAVGQAQQVVGQTAKQAEVAVKETEKAVQETTKALEDAAKGLQGAFKNPFGEEGK